jgi:large subunit ribosomal protein L4
LQDALPAPKTKTLVDALEKIGASREEHTLLILNQLTDAIHLSARNVEKLELNTVDALKVYDVLRADKILIEKSALKYIQEFYGPKQSTP